VPGEQDFAAVGGDDRSAEVARRRDGVQLRRLEHRIQRRRDRRTVARLGPEVIPPADDWAANPALGGVVVERDPRVTEEAGEPFPVADRVGGRLADGQGPERGLPVVAE